MPVIGAIAEKGILAARGSFFSQRFTRESLVNTTNLGVDAFIQAANS